MFHNINKVREGRGISDVALVRMEQLYPFPTEELSDILEDYPSEVEVAWAQEEPANMGTIPYIRPPLRALLDRRISLISRTASASPATGSNQKYHIEQAALADEALN